MKICPLCGSAMQDTDQFCTSCGNSHETQKENPLASQPPQPVMLVSPVPEPTAPTAPVTPIAPPALAAPIAPAARAEMPSAPQAEQPPQMPQAPASGPFAGDGSGQPQQGAARPLYGTQAAYGQLPQQNPYAQQPTYAPYTQGIVPPPPFPQQGMYQAAPPPAYPQNETVSLGEWMLNYLILMVPVVNIVMLCIWGFGNSAKTSVRNWARASLIWMGISMVLVVVFLLLIGFMVSAMMSYGYYGY